MGAEVASVIVRRSGELGFVPAEQVVQILPPPPVSVVPGADFGMALVAGRVVATVEVSPDRTHALLCNVDGQEVVFLGLSVVASGFFEAADASVRFENQSVRRFNLEAPVRVLQGRFHP